MGKPCGCGGAGVIWRCGVGLVCAGVGSTADPLTISWAVPLDATACGAVMSCVGNTITSGLIMVGGRLGVRLTPGGGLEFDSNGAIRATGGGGGGGTGWRTIADLETRGQDIVIGAYGAGYLHKPENHIRSYRYGQFLGLDAMYVPVRFLVDGYPIVHTDESMGRLWGEPWNTSFWTTQQIQNHHGSGVQRVPSLSGINDPYARNQPDGDTEPYIPFNATAWSKAKFHGHSPLWGWFGYNEAPQYGMTYLSDVFREVGGRTPLVLDLRFPARVTGGAFVNSTPGWKTNIFLDKVLKLIQQFGLSSSVVVTSTEITIPPDNPADPQVSVLDRFSSAGIRVGPFLETSAQATAHPPDGTWPTTWTWAFCNVSTVTKTQVAAYRDKVVGGNPLRTIAFMCNRQHTWNDRVKSQNILGGISGDPFYAVGNGGVAGTHVLGQPSYRRATSDWQMNAIDHGHFAPTTTVNDVQSVKRAYHESDGNWIVFGPDTLSLVPGNTAYVNQGWLAPVPSPTSWAMDVTIIQGPLVASGQRSSTWMSIAFCRANDLAFADYHDAATNTDTRTGYVLYFDHNGTVTLQGWNNSSNTVVTLASAASGGSFDTSNPLRFKIGINATGIRVRRVNVTTGATINEIFSVTTAVATQHRGSYVQFGRQSSSGVVWYGYLGPVSVTATGATDGPP
jgi:hypothetical protein